MSPASPAILTVLAAVQQLTLCSIGVAAATSYLDFHLLNVNQTLMGTKTFKFKPLETSEFHHLSNVSGSDDHRGEWELKLVHRDKLSSGVNSTFHHDHGRRFDARMKRDVKRVASLLRRLPGGGTHDGDDAYELNDFGSDVISGMAQGSGEYFVRIGVGSPPRSQYMVIDSGSDIVWVQCQPCNQCYRQSDPVFNPADSASFAGVSCSSSVCDRLQNSGCNAGRSCRYEVSYGDGSYTKGTLALETLTFGRTVVKNVAIGCGHINRGMFIGAAGLLGLGGGSMSLVGQLGGQTGGAFSYCLVSRGTDASGSLVFGRGAMPVGASWVPLLRNSRAPSFYYVGLSGVGVGGIRVPIPEQIFRLNELGYGGVVMDTGTAVTRFPASAYNAFRNAFISQTSNLPRATGVSIFDTCYNLSGFVSVRVPTISFYFSSGPTLTLPARNFLIPVDDMGTFCFAFASSDSGISIIGNIQQEGIQISFDGANGFVGFGPNVC
ncbi:Protein ASPARTIC PROTEASE IN GUARD CELL 2 [Hibiscus syriacus]|uniref:Protein ASPARTIC PROTEASE IN GUARD CELL 2 n=1 Tax=Hibiscus syriacus TaxID=106335 RepID=A0A6A2Y2R4_HIBSY|nr:protein ASPARTIC PROTEASE IN GUARD CELL 2-like [Hibiscus syriacus]KAE8677870.1 Protein ASPARTIC PROTEASE IN GUARD CELL 2 [Hibiscus syriacus]